jgi:hypothetical protein
MALLVSSEAFPVPPKMYGKLHIISNLKNEAKK